MREQFSRVRCKPEFDQLYKARKNENCEVLWNLLSPVFYQHESNAKEELEAIIVEAQNFALEILSGLYDYRYEYAAVGEPFDIEKMYNRDFCINADSETLMKEEYRVKLSITPIVHFFNPEIPEDNLLKVVHRGDVVLEDNLNQGEP